MHAAVARHGREGRGGVRGPLHVPDAVPQVEREEWGVRAGVAPELMLVCVYPC